MLTAALVSFGLFVLSSVCLFCVWHQLRLARQHLNDAIKICEDAVKSLRSGGP